MSNGVKFIQVITVQPSMETMKDIGEKIRQAEALGMPEESVGRPIEDGDLAFNQSLIEIHHIVALHAAGNVRIPSGKDNPMICLHLDDGSHIKVLGSEDSLLEQIEKQ